MKIHYISKVETVNHGYTLGNVAWYTALCKYDNSSLSQKFTKSKENVTCKHCLNRLNKY